VRDEAIIRVLYNTGCRLSEVANLELEDVDLSLDSIRFHGKGAKDRRVRIGPKTARALSRFLRTRGEPQRLRATTPVAGGTRGPAADRQRHQAHAQTARPTRRGFQRTCSPLAAQLRARVETGRGRHR
jgi:site-specific recombinase XerC